LEAGMKKLVIAIVVLAIGLAAFLGIERHSCLNAQIPLQPGFVETVTEYSAEELKMIDALAYKCVKEGIIDMSNEIKDGDGDNCVIALCGEKAANAELPEVSRLLRECYNKHGFIYPPLEDDCSIIYEDGSRSEWCRELDRMVDSMIYKCINMGTLDTAKASENDDGEKCATILCGEKTAKAEFPETDKLIRECYDRHFPGKRSFK
jgi:hypothetical protein